MKPCKQLLIYLLCVCMMLLTFSGCLPGDFLPESTPGYLSTTTLPPIDTTPPVILGASDVVVYAGNPVDLIYGVVGKDECEPVNDLSVDDSAVAWNTPGRYTAYLTATDASGNQATQSIMVTVLEWRPGYVTIDAANASVDAVLKRIIKDAMTDREKVEAIYTWVRGNIGYVNSFKHSDPYQAAYLALQNRSCDCYGFFAVCKLMFDRLGIPNIDVVKVKNFEGDSAHYWSMVSVDGGRTYYHFDATSRVGPGDDFCLVTDAFLDAYSDSHNGTHNRDKSLYPETPEA